MSYKRILTVQDISCVGQCSLTVALPILSACGLETAILPSAILSTHTAGFSGYTFRDLSKDMPSILNHWVKENIKFEGIYTGYLGSSEQVEYVLDIVSKTLTKSGKFFVDPAMADNGKLYPGFDSNYVESMKKLSSYADYLIPNITEACLLADVEYKEEYDREYIDLLIKGLKCLGAKNIILTGVSYKKGKTGVVVYENDNYAYYEHDKLSNSCHGTGDIYASSFVGLMLNGKSAYNASRLAADYTVECIKQTASEKDHWYGAKFEPALKTLISFLD